MRRSVEFSFALIAVLLTARTALPRPNQPATTSTEQITPAASNMASRVSALEPGDTVQHWDESVTSRALLGGYGAPELKLTDMLGKTSLLFGAQGGWILDHRFVIGIALYGTTIDLPARSESEPSDGVLLGYGGLRAAYLFLPHDPVHFGFGLLLGGGGFTNTGHHLSGTAERIEDNFYAAEPSLEVEANLSRHVRIALAGSYRYLSGEGPGFGSSSLSGPALGSAVKLGIF